MSSRGQGKGLALAAILLGMSVSTSVAAKAGDAVYASLGDTTRSPIGWVEFCAENPGDCRGGATQPRDIVMSQTAWRDLLRVNKWVNETIKPITDMDHWGVVEKWSLPTDGYGDCEDYVLLKRRILIERGFPESTLLITVVRDENNEGHAVLTVRTDAGDFVLDNKRRDIVRWADTPYTFIKRQSEKNPLVWISLLPPETAPQTTVSASNSH
jgi:predicted transglutaminase-like cysteine proteinase